MDNIIAGLDKIFESRIRLGIMSVLSVNESADFNTMKELMQLTDGNLASHIKALEKAGYIRSAKTFVGRKPNTTYTITRLGQKSFQAHIDALEKLLK
ncbi:MAG: transcriptional regulator [Rikenellaceae bacterium]|nr:transcriptional regulator [Rikenellaceae bacterium]